MIRQAVVLAGGRGSRLGPLTATMPKPLLEVGGRPFIEWILDNLRRHGVTEMIITVGYRADDFRAWLARQGEHSGVSLFEESVPLDTGGALTHLLDRLDDAFFVLNGDTLFDVPLGALGLALSSEDVEAAIALRPIDDAARYGAVSLSGDRVSSFGEKTTAGAGLINGGAYAFRRSVLAGTEGPLSLERDLLPELVARGRVRGLQCDGFFIDIGVPNSFSEAQESVPAWWKSAGPG